MQEGWNYVKLTLKYFLLTAVRGGMAGPRPVGLRFPPTSAPTNHSAAFHDVTGSRDSGAANGAPGTIRQANQRRPLPAPLKIWFSKKREWIENRTFFKSFKLTWKKRRISIADISLSNFKFRIIILYFLKWSSSKVFGSKILELCSNIVKKKLISCQ